MVRGPIYQNDYRPQLSGHETFPLRYGWLKKAFDAVDAIALGANKTVFLDEDAVARFGVGKNMVASIRHWASAVGVLAEQSGADSIETTELGRKLFRSDGLDPFMEHPATLWLIHWQLASRPEKTTWFWAFNHYPAVTFERESIIKGLTRLSDTLNWSRVANATIRNDVSCFIRTYAAQRQADYSRIDDTLESPLSELGLIKTTGKRDGFRFVRGPKSTLGDGVFVYALLDFWSRYAGGSATLSFEAIAHEPGGLGRVFLLDENNVADRLSTLGDITDGALEWSETAGLKQVVRNASLDFSKLDLIDRDYVDNRLRQTA